MPFFNLYISNLGLKKIILRSSFITFNPFWQYIWWKSFGECSCNCCFGCNQRWRINWEVWYLLVPAVGMVYSLLCIWCTKIYLTCIYTTALPKYSCVLPNLHFRKAIFLQCTQCLTKCSVCDYFKHSPSFKRQNEYFRNHSTFSLYSALDLTTKQAPLIFFMRS